MLKPICLLSLCCLLPAQYRPAAKAELGRGLRTIQVADLLYRAGPQPSPRLGRLTVGPTGEEDSRAQLLTTGEFRCVSGDQLIELLRQALDEAAEDISMSVRGDTLLVSGPEEKVAKVEQTVTALRQAITQRFSLRARLYRIGTSQRFPATATAGRLAELTKDLALLWEGNTTTLNGQQTVLAQEKLSRYVHDVSVEVAEESSIGEPNTKAMFEGIRLIVESHALIGTTDRIFKCQFAIGERDKAIELLSSGVQSLPAIGIPHLRASSGGFSGRVDHDGALLLAIQSRKDAGSNVLLVLQAGTIGGPAAPEASAGRTLLLPISALTSRSLLHELPFSEKEEDPEGSFGSYPDVDFSERDDENRGDTLLSLVRESLGELLDEEDASIELTDNGLCNGYMLIRGTERVRTEARRLLAALQDEWLASVEVRLQTGLRPVDRTDSTFSNIKKDAAAAVETMHVVSFPCLLGHTALVYKGVESAVISDYSVEIASKSSISDPIVRTTFSGIVGVVRPNVQGKNIGSDLRVLLHYIPEPSRQPTAESKGGDLYHIRVNRAQFHRSGKVDLGQAMQLGWGPRLNGEQVGLRMHQTVRFRKL